MCDIFGLASASAHAYYHCQCQWSMTSMTSTKISGLFHASTSRELNEEATGNEVVHQI
jgi:hypothetical protein